MIGNEENKGILPQTMDRLLAIRDCLLECREFPKDFDLKSDEMRSFVLNEEKFQLEDLKYEFECFEIYNEDIMDLSQDPIKDKTGQFLPRIKLQLKENNRKIFIKGALFFFFFFFFFFLQFYI